VNYLDYRPLLVSVCRSVRERFRTADQDELFQEGLVLIWKILSEWQEDQGSPAAYLRVSLTRHLNRIAALEVSRPERTFPNLQSVSQAPAMPDTRPGSPLCEMYLRCRRRYGRASASKMLRVPKKETP
jgi:DNA-directed RNA polymerase specialized sigma24 family protein